MAVGRHDNRRWAAGTAVPPPLIGAIIGLAAVALRLPRAWSDSFWQDEVASARILGEPSFTGMLHHVARTESTPPFWYALGWVAHRAGLPIHDIRLLSVAFDGILVLLVVVLASRLVPAPLAALAGVLVAVGGQFAAHGRELRAYELLALLTLVFGIAVSATARKPTATRLAGLGAVTGAGALTHYFFFFTAAAGLAWLWFERVPRASRVRACCAIAVGLATFLAWLPRFLEQYRNHRYSWIGPFRAQLVADTPLRLFTPFLSGGATAPAAAATLLAVGFGAMLLWRRSADGRLCAVLALAPVALAAATWAAGFRVYAVRNMIGIGPFVAIALVAALARLPRRATAFAAVALGSAAIGTYGWNQLRPTASYSAIAQALVAEGWRPHDAVAVVGSFYAYRSPLEWYLPGAPVFGRARTAARLRPFVFLVAGRERLSATVDSTTRRVGNLVVARLRIDGAIRGDPRLRGATVLSPVRSSSGRS